MSIEHEIPLEEFEDDRWQRSQAVLFPRRGSFQSTGAFEDISVDESRQPVAQKWRVAEGRQQSTSQLPFGFPSCLRLESGICCFRGDGDAYPAHDPLDERNRAASDTQRADAEPDERERHQWL